MKQPLQYPISIFSKHIGTTTTEEGEFYLSLTSKNLQDTLSISSMGFESKNISIKDFVLNAKKQSKDNFVSDNHKINILYRRSSVEQNISKFFVEQYLSIRYKGPSSYINKIQVLESRKSSDYRVAYLKINEHPVNVMASANPLYDSSSFKRMKWKKNRRYKLRW